MAQGLGVDKMTAIEAYLLEHHVSEVTWHTVLNNHASTRPKSHGGRLVESVTECKEYAARLSGEWRCTLTLPNSFAPGDGLRVVATGEGRSKTEASEMACLRAVVSLISESPSDFLLRPAHWDVSPDELVANMPGADPASGGHPALPVHTRGGCLAREAGEEADAPDADARLAALVRDCLNAHGGEFDPSWISHKQMGFAPNEERAYHKFNRLLAPGELKDFLERHADEFTWNPKASNAGMVITWAHGARQPAVGAMTAGGAATQEEGDARASPDQSNP